VDQDLESRASPAEAESLARAAPTAPPLPNPRSTGRRSTLTTKDTGSTFHRNLPAAAAPRAAASQASPVEARAARADTQGAAALEAVALRAAASQASPAEAEAKVERADTQRAAALEAAALLHPLASLASPVEEAAEERAVRANTQGAAAARPLLLPAGMGQGGMADGADTEATADGAVALEDGHRLDGKLPRGMVDGPIPLLLLLVPPLPARLPYQAAVESLASPAVESLARVVDGNQKDPVFEKSFLPRTENFCWKDSFGTTLARNIPGCLVDIKCHHLPMERLLFERECVERDLTLVPPRPLYPLFL